MLRLIFLGPPGAGKGTQAANLARELGVAHLSTGDLLRSAVAAGTPLGRQAEGHMRAGRLVPDDLVLGILRERLSQPDARPGFILDGFPRNVPQAKALAEITPLDRVVSFELSSHDVLERLVGRRVCPRCQTVYNVVSRPPREAGRCDLDGADLEQRPDDRPEAITTRLAVYAEQTAPLLEHYGRLGLLRPIDARGSPDDVARRLRTALEERPRPSRSAVRDPTGSRDPSAR